MVLYMMQFRLTTAGWTAMLENPTAYRGHVLRGAVERLGGSVKDIWLMVGEHDGVVICELPDAVNAAAISIAYSASGMIKDIRTSTLLTFDEAQQAVLKAAGRKSAGE